MKKKKFNLFTWLLDKRELSLALLIVMMCIVLSFTTDTFLTPINLFNILKQAAITVVLACGLTFIISGGGIDLSMANNMCLASVTLCMVYNATGSSILALIWGVFLAMGIGALNGGHGNKAGVASLHCYHGYVQHLQRSCPGGHQGLPH